MWRSQSYHGAWRAVSSDRCSVKRCNRSFVEAPRFFPAATVDKTYQPSARLDIQEPTPRNWSIPETCQADEVVRIASETWLPFLNRTHDTDPPNRSRANCRAVAAALPDGYSDQST